MENKRAAIVLLLSCIFAAELQTGQTLTCQCSEQFVCLSGNTCQVNGSLVGCRITRQYRNGIEETTLQQCLSKSLYVLANCQEDVEQRRPGNGVLLITYCCHEDNCNTVEALEELIADQSLAPTTMTTTTSVTTSAVSSSSTQTRASSPAITGNRSTVTMATVTMATFTTTSDNLQTRGEILSTQAPAYAIVVITLLSATVLTILTVIAIVLCIHFYPHHLTRMGAVTYDTPTITMTIDSGSYGEPSLNELLEYSGSGSGLPLLIQRSIAGQIALHELVGKGRFGEVWKGMYKGDEVAVKIFHTREETSWFHEVEIYQTCLMRHPNILRFIAADNKDIGIQTQLWLITEFCERGSLYDLLENQTVNEATMLKLCYTAACGLDHLHTDIVGKEGKPPIVHRDLKTRNILVKGDYSCCIADLGLALRFDKMSDLLEDPPSKRVGTKRYLAPEILDESICVKSFDCFKRADIYSFGLILWETARRGECEGYAEEPQLPYHDAVPADPTFEDMKKVVVIDRRRPDIPNKWSQSEVFRGMSKIIQQCWLHSGEARLTALRVKKNLANLKVSKSEKQSKEEQS